LNQLTQLQTLVSGKKTYIALIVGMAAIALNHFGFWPTSLHLNVDPGNWVNDEYTLILGLFSRAAVAKVTP